MTEYREGNTLNNELTDSQLLRYSRHLLLPQVDARGQLAICNGSVLVVGAGGLGSPVAMYLAAAGVGQLILVDDDTVELSNLQRQIAHAESLVGQPKVRSAERSIKSLNSEVALQCIEQRMNHQLAKTLIKSVNVVVDCSDNFATRKLLNQECWLQKKPLVSGAAIRLEGQLTSFDFRETSNPCYICLYGEMSDENLTCSQSGVLSPLVGIIGSAQAVETLKILGEFGRPLIGRLQLYDALNSTWRELKYQKNPNCPCCSQKI